MSQPADLPPRDPATIGHIVQTPGVVSGDPRIAGTRIQTRVIWAFHEGGATVEEILRQYPTLTADDVCAALAYEQRLREKSA
jgi:uncharacterized protein (DUF433 family)